MESTRPRPAMRFAGLIGIVLAAAACAPSMDEVIARHRAPVQGVFDRLKALEAAVRSAPAMTADLLTPGGARVVLEGDNSNTLFIRADDLSAPDRATSNGNGATRAGAVAACGEALRGEFAGVAKGAELFLKECGRAEFAFVLRTTSEQAAEITGSDSYQPGSYEGDVLLFRLADGSSLGGFHVSATNSEQVMARKDSSGNVVDVAGRLESDLSANAFAAIDAKLRKLLPGVIPAERK